MSETATEQDAGLEGYNGEPILTSGDGGAPVAELCAKLAAAGYETPVSKGEAAPLLTNEVYAVVEQFRQANDVEDEIVAASQGGRGVFVGPDTWAALNQLGG